MKVLVILILVFTSQAYAFDAGLGTLTDSLSNDSTHATNGQDVHYKEFFLAREDAIQYLGDNSFNSIRLQFALNLLKQDKTLSKLSDTELADKILELTN
jgi:hypothetical protein